MKVLAAAVGAAVLAIGGVAVADQAGFSPLSSTETIAVVAEIPPPCVLSSARGTVNDPCNVELLKWQQEFRNGLGTNTYYAKWRSANPGEYGRLRTWGTSAQTTPQPMVATGYGAVVRYGLDQCRTWAPDLASCLLP